jgi:predicted hydrocarbon binding protein
MEEIISKEEFNQIMKIKGEGRGIVFKPELEFIIKEEGEIGLQQLEEAMEKIGHPLRYKTLKSMDLYPLKKKALMLILMRKLFNYNDEKFKEIGGSSAKFPALLRRLVNFLMSSKNIKDIFKHINNIWKMYFTVGELEMVEFHEKEGLAIIRLEDFRVHPLECKFLIGFWSTLLQLLIKKEVTCEETKCMHKGDEYHEFLLKW